MWCLLFFELRLPLDRALPFRRADLLRSLACFATFESSIGFTPSPAAPPALLLSFAALAGGFVQEDAPVARLK